MLSKEDFFLDDIAELGRELSSTTARRIDQESRADVTPTPPPTPDIEVTKSGEQGGPARLPSSTNEELELGECGIYGPNRIVVVADDDDDNNSDNNISNISNISKPILPPHIPLPLSRSNSHHGDDSEDGEWCEKPVLPPHVPLPPSRTNTMTKTTTATTTTTTMMTGCLSRTSTLELHVRFDEAALSVRPGRARGRHHEEERRRGDGDGDGDGGERPRSQQSRSSSVQCQAGSSHKVVPPTPPPPRRTSRSRSRDRSGGGFSFGEARRGRGREEEMVRGYKEEEEKEEEKGEGEEGAVVVGVKRGQKSTGGLYPPEPPPPRRRSRSRSRAPLVRLGSQSVDALWLSPWAGREGEERGVGCAKEA